MTEIRIRQLDLRDLSTSNLGSANAVANLESNIVSVATTVNSAINTVSANADTLTTLLNTVSGNIDAAASLVSTISGNADTFASLVSSFASYGNTNFVANTYIDGEVANLIASAPTALNTLQELATAINNDAAFFSTITGLADTVNDNTASIASNIDGIQSNLDSYATYANSQFGASSNISLTVGGTTISNTTIFVEGARSSVYANTNTTSKTLTFTHTMGNATSQEFTMNGSTNALTLGSTATSNTNMYFVFYNGLALKPDEYTVSGSTMTLANVDPIISGSNVEVRYLDFFGFRETAVPAVPSFTYQGSSYGFTNGGERIPYTLGRTAVSRRFAFASDGTGNMSYGELTDNTMHAAGSSSSTHAYVSGGSSSIAVVSKIDKWQFDTATNFTNIGDLAAPAWEKSGHSSDSNGYAVGGRNPSGTKFDTIEKIPFSSDTDATDIAELPTTLYRSAGISSAAYGYAAGGRGGAPGTTQVATIFKFSVLNDAPGSTVGDLINTTGLAAGISGDSYGYVANGDPYTETLQKFPFASDANATDIGEVSSKGNYNSGFSSTTAGYITHGYYAQSYDGKAVYKFPFASDVSTTSISPSNYYSTAIYRTTTTQY